MGQAIGDRLKSWMIHDNAVATHLYRIAQEAIQNAIRHGQAKFIVINLLTQNDRIVLGVNDDGVGFPKKPGRHKGMGLRIMRHRARLIGGQLTIQCPSGGGTVVNCTLKGQETSDSEIRKFDCRRQGR